MIALSEKKYASGKFTIGLNLSIKTAQGKIWELPYSPRSQITTITISNIFNTLLHANSLYNDSLEDP